MTIRSLAFVYRFLAHFRHPVSLPEDVSNALGITFSNFLSFPEFIHQLTSPNTIPSRLFKYMSRDDAEEAFETALRKERFAYTSLYSYYFNDSWLEFMLQFDDEDRLRRIYLYHRDIQIRQGEGIEISLLQNHAKI